MIKLRVLVACEESQSVCKEFRKLGHEAYSNDLQECSGGHPEWHLQMDSFDAINLIKPNLLIGHPPCTFISKAGARWMHGGGVINQDRLNKALQAKEFFLRLLNSNIEHIAIENPQPLKIVGLPPHTQVIQPYQFGDPYSKKTLLWLKGLPELTYTNVLTDYKPYLPSNTGGKKRGQKYQFKNISQKDSSKTFPGIAKAMASQWSEYLTNRL